jgi:hypothetical protein
MPSSGWPIDDLATKAYRTEGLFASVLSAMRPTRPPAVAACASKLVSWLQVCPLSALR